MNRDIIFPSEVRRALIEDHRRIRRLLDELDDLAERVVRGEREVESRFVAVSGQLRRAFEAHNEAEELHLGPVLQSQDAWGPLRVGAMFEEHAEEHAELRLRLGEPDPPVLAARFPALAADLRDHMRREEETFLSAELLRDDLVTSGPTS